MHKIIKKAAFENVFGFTHIKRERGREGERRGGEGGRGRERERGGERELYKT